jgi:hypothetical protein
MSKYDKGKTTTCAQMLFHSNLREFTYEGITFDKYVTVIAMKRIPVDLIAIAARASVV